MFEYEKYTPYVLTSYGIALVVIFGLLGWSVMRLTRASRKLAEAEAADVSEKLDAKP